MGRTKLYPMVQFKKDTWEIDEFDCASIFLLIGTEKAMVIDCGMGIGDLRGAIEQITDKPLVCVISHGHVDHTGNARQFDEIWIHPKDADRPIPQSIEKRKFDIQRIAKRQKGCIGAPYTMFNLYPFDIDTDLAGEDEGEMPQIRYLEDGMQFDLGGGRIVTAYECPGHSKGEMIFLDEQTRTMFCGDALNFNLGVGAEPVEKTLRYLKRMQSMSDRYDDIYNGHHDFRALGRPLDDDCLPNVIAILEDAVAGRINICETSSFWGMSIPLTHDRHDLPAAVSPDGRRRVTLRKGRNFVGIDPDLIFEKQE